MIIPLDTKPYPRQRNAMGCNYKVRDNRTIRLGVTGKLMATSQCCGGINRDNYKEALNEINDKLGLNICEYDFLNKGFICTLDIKKDINVKGLTNNYISALREKLYKKTSNVELLTFEKRIGFEESILIKPTTKTGRDSLTIYSKYLELLAHKYNDLTYFNQFSTEFLESCQRVIRIERRLQSFHAIRNAFHLIKGKVYMRDVLFSNIDVVEERLSKLLGGK